MPETPYFSVVIPTYNRAAKVVRAVESVLAQTWKDYEILVVDDGSTDCTAEILQPFLPRIRYFSMPNQGAAAARNFGISQAKGEYIAFLDADDRWLPERLTSTSAAIRSHPEAGLLCTGAQYADEDGQVLWTVEPRLVGKSAYFSLLRANFVVLSGAVVKKSCLTGDLFDERLITCEDWDLWIRLSRQNPVQIVPGAFVLYEYAAPDKLTSNHQKWIAGHDRVLEKAFAADPSLSSAEKNRIRSSVAYIKGRICLEAGANREARQWFAKTLPANLLHWKAWIYLILLTLPFLRSLLPLRIKTALRLPEIWVKPAGAP